MLLIFIPYYCLQVRSYCRGVVVRAVDPATRARLFARLDIAEVSSLRSFLDKPQQQGKTVKGSGLASYFLHERNHIKKVVSEGTNLHKQVHSYTFHDYMYTDAFSTYMPMSS